VCYITLAYRHWTATIRQARHGSRNRDLRVQALKLLARREHTRAELKSRLQDDATDPEELEAILDEFGSPDLALLRTACLHAQLPVRFR